MAGSPDYQLVRQEFYLDAQGVLLVYDASKRASFDGLDAWWDEARRHGASQMDGVLVANKLDSARGEVEREEGELWAQEHGLAFIESSAATGLNVRAAMLTAVARALMAMPGKDGAANAAMRAASEATGETSEKATGGAAHGRRRAG